MNTTDTYNPFVDDDEDTIVAANESEPRPDYNPFLDDEDEQIGVAEDRLEAGAPLAGSPLRTFVKPATPTVREHVQTAERVAGAVRQDTSRTPDGAYTCFTKPASVAVTESVKTVKHVIANLDEGAGEGGTVGVDEPDDVLAELLEDDDDPVAEPVGDHVVSTTSVRDDSAWRRKKTPEERREMRRREREAQEQGIILPGHKKRTKNLKYKRGKITERDIAVFEFLGKGRFATAAQVGQLLGVTNSSAAHRLRGLNEWQHMVNGTTLFDGRTLWTLGKNGLKRLLDEGNLEPFEVVSLKASDINPIHVKHTLSINQAILTGLSSSLGSSVGRIELAEVLSETAIERAFMDVIKQRSADQAVMAVSVLRDAYRAAEAGKVAWSEVATLYPSLWVPVDIKGTGKTHRPDFVINREHLRTNAEPVSFAVEVEISGKSPKELRQVMAAYAQDRQFKKIVYVMKSEAFARKVHQAAKGAGIGSKVEFVKLLDRDGHPFTGKMWRL